MQAIRVILFGFSSAISTLCNICRFFKQIMTLWIVWKCKRSFNSFFKNCWEALMCFEKTASVLEHFYSCTCCNMKLSISNLYCYWRAVKKYLAPFWFFLSFLWKSNWFCQPLQQELKSSNCNNWQSHHCRDIFDHSFLHNCFKSDTLFCGVALSQSERNLLVCFWSFSCCITQVHLSFRLLIYGLTFSSRILW